ncbi:MAG: hypothetical protein V4805_05940 [Pseudomonadota bacterium]
MKPSTLYLRLLMSATIAIGLSACGGSSNVSNITLGGSVTGLTTDGLVLINAGSTVSPTITQPRFTFPWRVSVDAAYFISVQTQPPGQTCTIAKGSGIAGGADITDVLVTCVANRSLGGSITGLSGTGLVLANGSDSVSPKAGDTTFTFPTKVGVAAAYGVTVFAQPAGQSCTVVNGAAFMGDIDVTNVQINCL